MDKNEFPIMAFLGVHNCPNIEENYKQFADCGFNISLNYFGYYEDNNHTSLKEACELADKYGISIISNTYDIHTNPKKMAEQLKNQKGFYGYYIIDEPTVDMMKFYQQNWIKPILEVDNSHAIYMNLLPNYNKEVAVKAGAKDYTDYLEQAKIMDTTQVSFDFYPILKSRIHTYIRMKAWYKNLQQIADYSKSIGKNFWGFILSVPHSRYPQPTIEHMRIQAFTNLAYGAQGIEYFTYQTPTDGTFDFHDGPIEKDYKTKTKTWDITKQMNTEIKNISHIFYHGNNFKVVHSKCGIFFNYINELPDNIKQIHSSGNVLMSTFENNGHKYMMLVNKSFRKDTIVKIRLNKGCTFNCIYGSCVGAGKFFLSKGNCAIFEI